MLMSPSTRRAWIEIGTVTNEGGLGEESPSTRRAWIEIGIIWDSRLSN